MCAGRNGLLARTALWCAQWVDEAIVVVDLFGGSQGAGRRISGQFVLAALEEIGHEARHFDGVLGGREQARMK